VALINISGRRRHQTAYVNGQRVAAVVVAVVVVVVVVVIMTNIT
jgi:hypothetical protein